MEGVKPGSGFGYGTGLAVGLAVGALAFWLTVKLI